MKETRSFKMALFCPLMLVGIMFSTISATVFTKSNALKVEALGISEASLAKIGTEGYDSLEEAINSVQNGETIVILKDVVSDTPISIKNGKTFTIDFDDGAVSHSFMWNGTIESKINENIFVIDNNSDVTVNNFRFLACDSDVQGNTIFEVNSNGKLKLINMESKDDYGKKNMPVLNNGGTVIIDGGNITTYVTDTLDISPNKQNPIVQNLNNATTTFKGNGIFNTHSGSCGAWLGRFVSKADDSSDVDVENSCGTVTIENGTFNGGHIVDVNGKGNITINNAITGTGNGPAIRVYHGGIKSNITINNVTSSTTMFIMASEKLVNDINFENGNVKYTSTRFCVDDKGKPIDAVSIKNGKFGPKTGTADIHDEIEGYLADGAIISALTDDPDGYTYKVEMPVRIADILPEDFPTSETYAWRSGSNKLYLLDSSLYVTGSDSASVGYISSIVVKNGNTYVYDPQYGATLTFNMSEADNSILQSITISEDEQFNGTYEAPHIHNFSYVANDNVITATCTEGCIDGLDENPLTLTLVCPSNLAFDGNEKNVTFATGESDSWTAAGLKLPAITYFIKESGETEYSPFSGIPKNVGDFMAKITVNEKEAQLLFTIGKATPFIKNLPSPSDINLGQKLSDSTLANGYVQFSSDDSREVPGLFEWAEPNTIPSLVDSEVTEYDVTFTPFDEDYFEIVSCTVTIRVNHSHNPSKVDGQAPTETTPGWRDYYECSCGALFEDEIGNTPIDDLTTWKAEGGNGYLDLLGHNYQFVEFVWNEFTAQAKYVCSNDPSHVEYHTATVTSEVTTQPTCTTTGVRTYTATYDGHTDTKTETIQATNHSLVPQEGKTPTCTEDGYMEAYYCSNCGKYFSDSSGERLIGDLTAYNNWKLNEGKIASRHIANYVAGLDPTTERAGYKEAWRCSECGEYFEDEACTILIGDEAAYTAWKANKGYLPQLPDEGLSGGAIAGICIGALFLLLVIIYLIGYFFLYRRGKLDDKKIKVIYKILPRGEQKLEKND